MPIEKNEEETKKQDAAPPPAEAILADVQQRDPDEATSAQQVILNFVGERLETWNREMESAIDSFEAWVYGHAADEQKMFSERGFFDYFGDRLIAQLQNIAGGAGTPLMDAISGEVYNAVSFAQHSEFEIGLFLTQCRRGVRDACWYVRDNAQSILDKQWAGLLDLAYEGSYDFVPALHAMGLPSLAFKPVEFSSKLVADSEVYQYAVQPTKEAVVEQAPEGKKQEIENETQQLDLASTEKQAQPLSI